MLAALSLLALLPSALATIYVTQPTPSLPCVVSPSFRLSFREGGSVSFDLWRARVVSPSFLAPSFLPSFSLLAFGRSVSLTSFPSLPLLYRLQGGSPCTIIWAEDTNAPTLSTIGLASVGLWVGSQISQIELQVLSPSVEVAKTGQLIATIDPSVGSNMVRAVFTGQE